MLFIAYHIVFLTFYTLPFWIEISHAKIIQSEANFTDHFQVWEIGITRYQHGFSELKPILRSIMESVIYVFILEGILNYVYNLIAGGRLIWCITEIADIKSTKFDFDKRQFGIRLLSGLLVFVLTMVTASVFIFNMDRVYSIFGWQTSGQLSEEKVDPTEWLSTERLLLLSFSHCVNFTILSVVPMLFVYTMIIFQKQIYLVIEEVQRKQELNEDGLHKLKFKLATLAEQYKRTLEYFSLPLTVINMANIYLIISSSCYLMISEGKRKYFRSLLFNFGMFGFARLVILCWAGSLTTTAYRKLLCVTYDHLSEWNLSTWMCFNEIKRLRGKFKTVLLDTYSVRQSSILTLLGFALNYIVILLQTENYGNKNQ